jgi:hypothetical protein
MQLRLTVHEIVIKYARYWNVCFNEANAVKRSENHEDFRTCNGR